MKRPLGGYLHPSCLIRHLYPRIYKELLKCDTEDTNRCRKESDPAVRTLRYHAGVLGSSAPDSSFLLLQIHGGRETAVRWPK